MAALKTWLTRCIYAIRQLGRPSQVGLVLLAASGLLGVGLMLQWRLHSELMAQLAQQIPPNVAQQAKQESRDITSQFYQLLPKDSQADALSADILKTADGLGLRFERAEYSAAQHMQTRLVQHQIKLPVRGTYMQVRQFLNALLNAHPTLALTELQIHREDVFNETVEANLMLTLYMHGEVAW